MRPVLIVEDHPLVAEATGKLLACYGDDIRTVICSNAAQAIEMLDDRDESWFRIFLDLDVPGAYGLSLAREVQQRGLASRCCVVSAFENREYIEEIRSWGFLGYITKAVTVAEFTAALTNVLNAEPSFSSGIATPPSSSSPRASGCCGSAAVEAVRTYARSSSCSGRSGASSFEPRSWT